MIYFNLSPHFFFFSVLSWADVPNWPQMPSKYKLGNLVETDDSTSRADTGKFFQKQSFHAINIPL